MIAKVEHLAADVFKKRLSEHLGGLVGPSSQQQAEASIAKPSRRIGRTNCLAQPVSNNAHQDIQATDTDPFKHTVEMIRFDQQDSLVTSPRSRFIDSFAKAIHKVSLSGSPSR